MTPDEAQHLLAACAAYDNRQPSVIAKRAWARALNKIPLDDDCFEAVARYYGTPAKDGQRLWIQPADVIAHRRTVRAERLENFVYQPPAGLDDPDFIKRLRGQQYAVGSGTTAAPSQAPALTGGPAKQVAAYLNGVGREVPDTDDDVAAVRRPGPLGIECPKCRAAIGRPCRTPRGKERSTHPARSGQTTAPDVERAEIESRKAASAAVLRRLEAGEAL